MNQSSDIDSANIICKYIPTFELDFLGAFYIHKNYNNVVSCDCVVPPSLDC